uniref:Lactosylceramide 4-alpha-galactosyltransferase n=1 Tax=Geotrypetes seraphini TaxID=260995 RepID=A0A6P8RMA9_GEOSA|nr:lactosylceramide 4-alpha-galactosyltransferase [Geotrypetes seraphini]XP_033806572.1 lactosylceramide 4-alpha-galactosyltransferase [Geotrypetes seraphini]XP_033806573.1 lactosylceramide 4-alpha-galactosyltransferase [Geotrypetes seraphini]XP_033806574.1 lactosylceramide 4-alpha-galactosyltransferase [Geotrypetes seraphini]
MDKMSATVQKLFQLAMKNKIWATFIIFVKFISFISIMMYLRIRDEDVKHSLPIEVKCPATVPYTLSSSSPLSGHGIYFLETSDQTNPNFLVMCSLESAARAHPKIKVTFLMKGLRKPARPKNLGISLLRCFPNIEIRPLNLSDLFANTPFASWYASSQFRWKPYRLPILSDACRLAIMWKYGGFYLDTDFIVLKNLKNLTNSLGIQSNYLLNGAFLSFEQGHKFIEICMQDFVDNYNAWIWGHQGPQLYTRVFKKWCSIKRLRDRRVCHGVSTLPPEAFYPIRWQDWMKYFEAITTTDFNKLFQNTYAAHVWNTKSQRTGLKLGSKTILDQLYSNYCPSTYEIMKMYL